MRWVKPAVFLVSMVSLAFELAVVRLASFFLLRHYAYFALAVAVLGGAVGAALVARSPEKWDACGRPGLGLGFSFLVGALGMAVPWPGAARTMAFIIFAGAPYLAVGAWLSRVFRAQPEKANSLYFLDLTGAATGVGLGFLLMRYVGPLALAITIGIAASGLALASAVHGSGSRASTAAVAALTLVPVVAVLVGGTWFSSLSLNLAPIAEKSIDRKSVV